MYINFNLTFNEDNKLMDDKTNISVDEKLVDAGRGVPQDQNDNSADNMTEQSDINQSDNLDERIRKAGA